jgi:hypothetical protein
MQQWCHGGGICNIGIYRDNIMCGFVSKIRWWVERHPFSTANWKYANSSSALGRVQGIKDPS